MKSILFTAAALSLWVFAPAAQAVDYATILIERPANASADDAWKSIGPYCSLSEWLNFPCEITKGNGVDVGSVRSVTVPGRLVVELLVSNTKYSYTYTQPAPNPTSYHGHVEVIPTGPKTSKIRYTIIYDSEPTGDAQARAAEIANRTKTFTAAVEKMVKMAERK